MKLEEMKKVGEARTKGEWTAPGYEDHTDDILRAGGKRICGACCCGGFLLEEDRKFAVTAANKWDKFIAVVEAAKALMNDPDGDLDAFSFGIVAALRKSLEELERD